MTCAHPADPGARTPGICVVVLPGDIDDPAAPSGGNRYDREVCDGLSAAGWRVREVPVGGSWPQPAAAALATLAARLAELPDGTAVLLDGLVACAAPAVLVPESARLRLAVLVHLPLADETGLDPDEAAELENREATTLRAVSAVIATSTGTAARLIERHGLAAERVHVVMPGVTPAPPTAGSAAGTRLACVATLTPRKGQDLLVEALASLVDLPWSCTFVGGPGRDPRYPSQLERAAAAAGLDERVSFTGPRDSAALAAVYAATDLLVLPSRAETYGMVVTEALARAIPVLGTAVDGVPEALGQAGDGSTPGILVPVGEASALASALRDWLGDAGLRARWRRSAAERRTALHGWDTTSHGIGEVLHQLERRGPMSECTERSEGRERIDKEALR